MLFFSRYFFNDRMYICCKSTPVKYYNENAHNKYRFDHDDNDNKSNKKSNNNDIE